MIPYYERYELPYDPRRIPAGIVNARPGDETTRKVAINIAWCGHIVGLLERLCDRDAWQGTDEEIDQAIQDTLELQHLFSVDAAPEGVAMPIGSMTAWAAPHSVSVPEGWLECEGQLLDRVEYAELFAVIGTHYNASVDEDVFQLPDCRMRAISGAIEDVVNVGFIEGVQEVTLAVEHLPAHSHTQRQRDLQDIWAGVQAGNPARPLMENYAAVVNVGFTLQTGQTGDGNPHTNMPPTIYMRWLIYAGI